MEAFHAGYIPAITLVTKAITIEIPTSDIEKSGRMTISKFEPLLEPALNGIPFMSNKYVPTKVNVSPTIPPITPIISASNKKANKICLVVSP